DRHRHRQPLSEHRAIGVVDATGDDYGCAVRRLERPMERRREPDGTDFPWRHVARSGACGRRCVQRAVRDLSPNRAHLVPAGCRRVAGTRSRCTARPSPAICARYCDGIAPARSRRLCSRRRQLFAGSGCAADLWPSAPWLCQREGTALSRYRAALRRDGWRLASSRTNCLIQSLNKEKTMRHLIVAVHPRRRSFNCSVVNAYRGALEEAGHKVECRDLYAMKFAPVLTTRDVGITSGRRPPRDVAREQAAIRSADVITFVAPLWWN